MVRFNPNLLIAEVTMKSFEGKEYKHCEIVSWWCAKTSIAEKSDFLLRNSIRNFFLQTINTVTCFICIMENLQKQFSTEPGPIQQCLGPNTDRQHTRKRCAKSSNGTNLSKLQKTPKVANISTQFVHVA